MNLLVETKNEYTTHLINTLTPAIFEGIQAIYKEAVSTAEQNEILRVFQKFLKEIPKWNQMMIEKENERIIQSVQGTDWIEDLAKATLKANLAVLMYNPTMKSQPKLDTTAYKNLKFQDFIHKIYVECARELWNNPYLFYHNYPPIEIKRNQRESMILIKDCIRETVRKMLPIRNILAFYLADDDIPIANDLNKGIEENILNKKQHKAENTNLLIPYVEAKTETTPLNQKILNIIHGNNSDVHKSTVATDNLLTPDIKIKDRIIQSANTSPIRQSEKVRAISSEIGQHAQEPEIAEPDEKIKDILKNDLGTNTEDLETSINYNPDKDGKKDTYYEVFSNSVLPNNDDFKKKQDFFNNYLKL